MLGGGAVAPAVPWYLAGGIPEANCIGAYKAINVVDQATSYDNLTGNATYDLTTSAAPTWNGTDGWIFDGISQFLNTAIAAVLNQNWSMAVRFTNGTTSSMLAGVTNSGNPDFYLQTSNFAHVNVLTISPAITSGILMICGKNCYAETTLKGTLAAATATNTNPIRIGAVGAATPTTFGVSKIQAYAVWDIDISAYQGAVHAAMAALPATP